MWYLAMNALKKISESVEAPHCSKHIFTDAHKYSKWLGESILERILSWSVFLNFSVDIDLLLSLFQAPITWYWIR